MIDFTRNGIRFGHRTVAVIIDGGRVLLQYAEGGDFWFLPGGSVEILEDSRQALVREMQEELELDVQVDKLVWVVENFGTNNNIQFHGVELFYLVALAENTLSHDTNDPIYGKEHGMRIIFQWFPLNALDEITLYPLFLKSGLRNLPETTEHIVVHL